MQAAHLFLAPLHCPIALKFAKKHLPVEPLLPLMVLLTPLVFPRALRFSTA
jgi:hypothetical protein